MSGLSVVTESGGYSLVAVCRLIIAVASLVAEHTALGVLILTPPETTRVQRAKVTEQKRC